MSGHDGIVEWAARVDRRDQSDGRRRATPRAADMRKPSPRHAKDARCQLLIEATIDALGRHGSANISVRHIAAEAGVSAGLVAHHFGGIENLLAAATTHWGERIHGHLDDLTDAAGPDARKRLEAHVAAWFHPTMLERTTLLAALAIEGLVPTMPAVAAAHARISSGSRARIDTLLKACFPHANHRLSAASLIAIIRGLRMGLVHESGGDSEFAIQCVAQTWMPAPCTTSLMLPQEKAVA